MYQVSTLEQTENKSNTALQHRLKFSNVITESSMASTVQF